MNKKDSHIPKVIMHESLSDITTPPENPNQLLHKLLEDNGLVLTVSAISDNNYIEGAGYVLTDKPLLVVTAKYK